jgi:hypothetical protein
VWQGCLTIKKLKGQISPQAISRKTKQRTKYVKLPKITEVVFYNKKVQPFSIKALKDVMLKKTRSSDFFQTVSKRPNDNLGM